MDLHWLSIAAAHAGLKKGDFSSVELTKACLEQMKKTERINSFITVTEDLALENAKQADTRLAQGENIKPLTGIPGALKDLFNTRGIQTSSGGNMLRGYKSPYDATVTKKLNEEGFVLLGKNNMDECACGVSNETSAFGPVHNPWNEEFVPGGSSGGSVASVAAGQTFFSLGTDTGGSIRQPASLCGVVGLKPTYGRVSRFGANAMASSFDHVGPITRSVEDAALVLQAIAGHDPLDATTPAVDVPNYSENLGKGVKGMTLGLPEEFFNAEGVDPEVREVVMAAVKEYEKMGATLKPVKMPMTKYGVAIYYILSPGELSTNLARLDGVRFGPGPAAGGSLDLDQYYKQARGEGFGDEIKRRIMVGTFVLSAGYADAYYKKAQKVRTLVIQEFNDVFKEVDALIAPTSPIDGFKLNEIQDPLALYALDSLTIPADSAGVPSISIPCGFSKRGLPIGMQIMTPQFEESRMLQIAAAFEQATEWHTKRPNV